MKVLGLILAALCALAFISAAVGLAVLVLLALGVKDCEDDTYNPNDYNPF